MQPRAGSPGSSRPSRRAGPPPRPARAAGLRRQARLGRDRRGKGGRRGGGARKAACGHGRRGAIGAAFPAFGRAFGSGARAPGRKGAAGEAGPEAALYKLVGTASGRGGGRWGGGLGGREWEGEERSPGAVRGRMGRARSAPSAWRGGGGAEPRRRPAQLWDKLPKHSPHTTKTSGVKNCPAPAAAGVIARLRSETTQIPKIKCGQDLHHAWHRRQNHPNLGRRTSKR